MKVRSGRFFFVSIVCMFVLAIGVFVGGVWIQYSRGRENALVEFRAIVQKAAAVFAQGAGDASAVKSGMDIIFASYPDLAAATVQINGKAVFAQQKSTGFLSMTPSGEPVITASSPMLITQSAPFTTGNGTPAFISALVYVMRPVSVYRVACVSFVIILTATIFAIIVVFLPHAQAEDSPEAEAPKPAPPREAVPAQAARCEAPPGVTEPPAARPEGERQPEEAPAEEGQAGAPQ
ncbi:MAG: hypothetical protein LBR23_05975, partial [Spirochaetaceae bacterium]|nr:hypothetical protein [Spirochaetaceae bacterium]